MRAGALALVVFFACGGGASDDASEEGTDAPDADLPVDAAPDAYNPFNWEWTLPAGFPTPLVPDTNPMNEAKVEVGRRLFYDTRMSGNETFSCASCHEQARAFTEDKVTSVGSTGQVHPRNSMSLANVAYLGRYTWASSFLSTLEQQAAVPIFGFEPVELGLRGMEEILLARLASEPVYVDLFAQAFPDDAEPISVNNVVKALAAFQRTMISGRSPFDRWQREGDQAAVSDSVKRGFALFNSEKAECFHCHSGFNFQDVVRWEGKPQPELRFHNTGLYNIDGLGGYPIPNRGIYEATQNPTDMGRFRAPTLRNIAVTAPYFHDGSAATLDDVIDHYAAAGRSVTTPAEYAGDGSMNPYKSALIIGFTLSAQERADLKAFLEALTDEEFLTDPKFSNPWP